jgi:hypothetical protein
MKPIMLMDTIQIEITNACTTSCSNCTRFCGHHSQPYCMEWDDYTRAVSSVEGFPHMIGLMGGEPLLHPRFAEMAEYACDKLGREHLGLWTAFPRGKEYLREVIVKCFGNIFLNDHTRDDIYHHPLLVGMGEVMEYPAEAYLLADQCWVQNCWSASINPHGAFFCEVAAAFSILFNEPKTAWPVEKGWWWKTPKDFTQQIETFCLRCGGALPLKRRASIDGRDDISLLNYEHLKNTSPKLKASKYLLHDLSTCLRADQQPLAAYKDMRYRDEIAKRYGIYLTMNEKGFQVPNLGVKSTSSTESYLSRIQKEWQGEQHDE